MKQLTRSEFNKDGTTYKSVTSPSNDDVTQITDIAVKNEHLAYSTDGSTFNTLTDEVQFVTSDTIYQSPNALPQSADNGTVYATLNNGELPISLYKYNGTAWVLLDQVRTGVLYYIKSTGLVYAFESTSPYWVATSYTNTNQLINGAGFLNSADLSNYATIQQLNDKYTKPATGIPKTDLAQGVQDSLTAADNAQSNLNTEITNRQNADSALQTLINAINAMIPTQASSSNQLADKNFVNSSINAFAAYYITKNAAGDPFATKAELNAATTFYSGGAVRTPTTNDYCIVLADETKQSETGVDPTTRYSYQSNQWEYQYTVNDTPLTAAQLSAINSGVTSATVSQVATNTNNISSLQTGKQDKLTAGNNITISNNTISANAPVTSVAGYTGAVSAANLASAILTGVAGYGDQILVKDFSNGSGYIIFASGLKMCWGTTAKLADNSFIYVGFPITFGSIPVVTMGTAYGKNDGTWAGAYNMEYGSNGSSLSRDGFNLFTRGSSSSNGRVVYWFAIGI